MSYRPVTDVWILARPKVKYYGAYPAGFLLKARDQLGVGRGDQVLHVCSGMVRQYICGPGCKGQTFRHFHGLGDNDLTMDLDTDLKPDIVGDVREERAWRKAILVNPQIQAVMGDPPYNPAFATHYKVGPDVLPNPSQIVRHAIGILPVGGRVGVLSMEWPRYPKDNARQIGLFGVVVGNGNIGRWYAVYERTA